MIKFKSLFLSMLFILGSNAAFAQFALPNSPVTFPSTPQSAPATTAPVYSYPRNQNYNQPVHHQRQERHHRNNFQNVNYFYPYGYVPSYTTYVIDGSPDNSSYINYPASTQQQSYPANIQTGFGTDKIWVEAQNGNVPDNAIIFRVDSNGNKTYYCQAQYKNSTYQGVLVAGDGCYVQDNAVSLRFTQYQALTQSR